MKKFVIDSNVLYIASAQIGEAWATVILEEIAKETITACTTVLQLCEILELYHGMGQYYTGKSHYQAFKQIIGDFIEVNEDDFQLSYDLFKKHPDRSPRELLTIAVMINRGFKDIISIDGPVYDGVDQVQRISLDKLLKTLKIQGNYVYERVK